MSISRRMVKRSEFAVTFVVSGSNLGDGIFFKNYYYFYFKTTMRVLAKIVLYYVQIQVSMKHSPPPPKKACLIFCVTDSHSISTQSYAYACFNI